ncbi:MAG: DapH/DapD/GlmU-related protein [Deferrisomatales bacterium]|nr:DapH/DapD/GlmU-related protein [Deferrisomatales bacterium]
MKTSVLDYLVAIPWITLNVAIAWWGASLLTPTTRAMMGPYHVLGDVLLWSLLYMGITGIGLRILLWVHPFRPGTYSMDSREFFVWKLYTSVNEMGSTAFLPFLPIFLRPPFFMFFGSRIGKNVAIGGRFIEPYLITAKDNAFFGGECLITAHSIMPGTLSLKPIVIEENAFIGGRAVVQPGVTVGANSVVAGSALVLEDTQIPPNEIWGGIPAKKIGEVQTRGAD